MAKGANEQRITQLEQAVSDLCIGMFSALSGAGAIAARQLAEAQRQRDAARLDELTDLGQAFSSAMAAIFAALEQVNPQEFRRLQRDVDS